MIDIINHMQSLITYTTDHKHEILAIGISTALFHLIKKLNSNEDKKAEDLQRELISIRTSKFIEESRDNIM